VLNRTLPLADPPSVRPFLSSIFFNRPLPLADPPPVACFPSSAFLNQPLLLANPPSSLQSIEIPRNVDVLDHHVFVSVGQFH
jgi:hypothetical protein